ncbi:MAG TPA: glycosyltransferase family 2 protein [Oligoflexia bacterium]|nr:glycosyltransferase family 2 protein [Oligoflexia bacterium]HMP47709.1 glycosyltransferase family 2 protein [Oligoflexia bacterium]
MKSCVNTAKVLPRDKVDNLVQIMSPVYNEGDAVLKLYSELVDVNNIHFDRLTFVYDFDGDTTLPFIKSLCEKDTRVRAEKNTFGKGVINAMKWGFSNAEPGPFIVVMADNSDKLSIIPELIRLWDEGAKVVVPSRYMKGGKQHGGPKLKKFLSGFSGRVLKLAGFPTSDPTNNFKLYDGNWLRLQKIQSSGGFEVALELTGKAFLGGFSIKEIPTEWWDRTQGKSNFRMWAWLPLYLKWYIPLLLKTPFYKLKRILKGIN